MVVGLEFLAMVFHPIQLQLRYFTSQKIFAILFLFLFTQQFINAAQGGNTTGVKSLFEQYPALINGAKDRGGSTALIWAADNGHTEICSLLVENGADVNQKNNNGYTALIWAASNGHKEVCSLLIENGADVNQKNNDGYTALILAAENGHTEICSLLVENGADVNQKNNNGYTALIWAASNGHKEVSSLLIENGADVNQKNNDGYTALDRTTNEDLKNLLQDNGAFNSSIAQVYFNFTNQNSMSH